MGRFVTKLVFLFVFPLVVASQAQAQLWNPFRSDASPSALHESSKSTASPQGSWLPQLSLPKLQSPFAPADPGVPTMTQRFNNSTQRFFTKTKEVVTAPIDAMSHKTSELSQWFQRPGSTATPREGLFSSNSSAANEKSAGPPKTVNEWLAQPRPE